MRKRENYNNNSYRGFLFLAPPLCTSTSTQRKYFVRADTHSRKTQPPARSARRQTSLASVHSTVTFLTPVPFRDVRGGEDAAVSRVLVQAVAEAAGVVVPSGFKSAHLFLGAQHETNGESSAGGESPAVEQVPTAELSPEPDAFEELVGGRSSAVLIVPRDTRGSVAGAAAGGDGGGCAAAAAGGAVSTDDPNSAEPEARSETPESQGGAVVVLRDAVVRAALPQGATVILPGSYNPLHRGHLGLMKAARALYSDKLRSEAAGLNGGGVAGGVVRGQGTTDHGRFAVHAIFEISVANADKGGLAVDEIKRRAGQFSEAGGVGWPYPVVISRAPLFSQKVGGQCSGRGEERAFCFFGSTFGPFAWRHCVGVEARASSVGFS